MPFDNRGDTVLDIISVNAVDPLLSAKGTRSERHPVGEHFARRIQKLPSPGFVKTLLTIGRWAKVNGYKRLTAIVAVFSK
jgi:hypothetical protein